MNQAVTGEISPEEAVETYKAEMGDIAQQIVDELNAQ